MSAGIATSTLLAALLCASTLMMMTPIQADDNALAESGAIKPDSLHYDLPNDHVGAYLARVGPVACTKRQVPALAQQRRPAS
jgi:hypothetical protein